MLLKWLDRCSDLIDIVDKLRNEAFNERHWDKMKKLTGYYYSFSKIGTLFTSK